MKWIMPWCMAIAMVFNAQTAASDKEANPLIIHNTNTIKVDNKRDPRDCSSCVGSEFKACMRSLIKEDFVKNVCALHPRACTAYVQQLKKDEMIEIRKLFTVQEWQALPVVFITAMHKHFQAEQKKADDAWWDRICARLMQFNAMVDN